MRIKTALLSLFILSATGCANMNPVPVTDANRNDPGIRYYETRPFLVVKRPYPIDADSYLIDGILSADGSSVLINGAVHNDFLRHFKSTATNKLSIQKSTIFAAGTIAGEDITPSAQADTPDTPATPDTGSSTDQGSKTGNSDTPEAKGDSTTGDTTGNGIANSNVTVQTDNTALPVFNLSDLFSITYLPDYDREFLIDASAKFGTTRLNLTRGPGGVLLAMSSEIDNSAVVKPLLDGYTSLVNAGAGLLKDRILPGSSLLASAQADTGEPLPLTKAVPGQPITLRIHKVKFAVPGVYPFIKGSEVDAYRNAQGQVLTSNSNGITTYKTWSDRKILRPVAAYQVPYDYFELLVVEQMLNPAGSSELVTAATSSPTEQNAGTQKSSDGAQSNPVNCAANKRPAESIADDELQSLLSVQDLNATLVITSREPDKGCLKSVTVKVSGTAADTDLDSVKLQLRTRWSKQFPGATLKFN